MKLWIEEPVKSVILIFVIMHVGTHRGKITCFKLTTEFYVKTFSGGGTMGARPFLNPQKNISRHMASYKRSLKKKGSIMSC